MDESRANLRKLIARILVTYNGQVLFVRRSSTGNRPGQWELPGGGVDDGETLEEGAIRELREETGIDTKEIEYVESRSYEYDDSKRTTALFKTDLHDKVNIQLSEEHDKFIWANRSTYNNLQLEKPYQKFFDAWFKNRGSESKKVAKPTTQSVSKLVIYTDGGSRGNPGPSASGYVIADEKEHVLEEGGEYLGITTNNQAEYQAVKLALEQAAKYKAKNIDFFIDSLLVVNQMNGVYKIKNRDLWPIHENIKELAKPYNAVTYTHVRREKNKLADAKVNEVLDSYNHDPK